MNLNKKETKKYFTFVIRDDDLSFFSSPEDIQKWYGSVLNQNIPVSFATIPFITLPNDAHVPDGITETTGVFPISNNIRLVEYIKSHPLIDILLHGCFHQNIGGIFEYQKKHGLFEITTKGKRELESTFDRPIKVFVAPHDQVSNHALYALENSALNLIRGKGIKNIIPRISYCSALIKMFLHRLRFLGISRSRMPAYPNIIFLEKHSEAFGIRIETGRENLFRALRFAQQTGGNFILVNHIHDMNQEKKNLMTELIKTAHEMGAEFKSASQLFD